MFHEVVVGLKQSEKGYDDILPGKAVIIPLGAQEEVLQRCKGRELVVIVNPLDDVVLDHPSRVYDRG